jgi:hypothetical protein
MESIILYPIFYKYGIRDVLPQIQEYLEDYYRKKNK